MCLRHIVGEALSEMKENIYPIHHRLLSRAEREARLGQRSFVLWMTGLSGSGKSTLAAALERRLFEEGYLAQVLDGDNLRSGLNANLGFSEEDRRENIRRIAEVAKLFLNSGLITICSFISPLRSMRQMARQIIGDKDFLELFVQAPVEVCEERDVKGLYAKARKGEIRQFTGVDAPYEEPQNPFCTLDTTRLSVEESVEVLLQRLKDRL